MTFKGEAEDVLVDLVSGSDKARMTVTVTVRMNRERNLLLSL